MITHRNWRALIFAFGSMIFAAFNAMAAGVDDHIVERAIYECPHGAMTIDEVAKQDFTPVEPIFSRGYSSHDIWLRIKTRPSDDGDALVLRIRPPFLDRVVLYAPDKNSPEGWARRVSGFETAFADRDAVPAPLGFWITPTGPETTYYLQITSTTALTMAVDAFSLHAAYRAASIAQGFEYLFFGFTIWLVFWAIGELLSRWDPLVAWFLAAQICYIFLNMLAMGHLSRLFPDGPAVLFVELRRLLAPLTILLTILFHRNLLRPFEPHRAAMLALDGLIIGVFLALLLVAAGHSGMGLRLGAIMLILFALVLAPLAFTAQKESPPGRLMLRIAYCVQMISLLASMLPLLRLIQAWEWNLVANRFHILISSFLMFAIMLRRSRLLVREAVETKTQLALTGQELHFERHARALQGRFMAMLTHELTRPLSVIRLSVDRLKLRGEPKQMIDRAMLSIETLISRCELAGEVENSQLQVDLAEVNVISVLRATIAQFATTRRFILSLDDSSLVTCDSSLLSVILSNLVENAVKYSKPEISINIAVAAEFRAGKAGMSLTVANVPGNAGRPDPARVFEKYYRSPGAQRESGSGLGLYIVQGLAHLMGGDIDFSDSGEELRFRLWLPQAAATRGDEPATQETLP